jgi:hypothetical protein
MPKNPFNMLFLKKRKGLRQGGKEGLKTSARNPLINNTPHSDKKFDSFITGKNFSPGHVNLDVNLAFWANFF